MSPHAKPLAGRRIVITRAPEQSSELVAALQSLGAEVLLMPMVEFAKADEALEGWCLGGRSFSSDMKDGASVPSSRGVLPASLTHVTDGFEWVLFTSQNAVRFFVQIVIEKMGRQSAAESFSKLKAGAVGPTTAEAARRSGFRVEYVAKTHTGEGLAQELAGELKGKRVLVPRSDRADGRFSSALRQTGAEVTEFIAYRTAAPKSVDEKMLRRVRSGEVDAVIFASPSAFHNLAAWIPAGELAGLSHRVQFTAIGPTTARTLRDSGARVGIEASDASAAALANSIAQFFEKQPVVRRA